MFIIVDGEKMVKKIMALITLFANFSLDLLPATVQSDCSAPLRTSEFLEPDIFIYLISCRFSPRHYRFQRVSQYNPHLKSHQHL